MVWAILLVFTGLTVCTGRMDLGRRNILIALVIATIKATLVVLFFMHMTEAAGPTGSCSCLVRLRAGDDLRRVRRPLDAQRDVAAVSHAQHRGPEIAVPEAQAPAHHE